MAREKVTNMLGYHGQARILGARRRHVNEIVVLSRRSVHVPGPLCAALCRAPANSLSGQQLPSLR